VTLVHHAIHDIGALNLLDFFLEILLFLLETIPVLLLDHLSVGASLVRGLDRVILLLVLSLRLARHAQEDHLFLSHLLDGLTSQDTTNAALGDLSGLLLLLLLGGSLHLAVVHALAVLVGLKLRSDLLQSIEVTSTTLATSLVLLDETDRGSDIEIESEGIVIDLLDRLSSIETLYQNVIDLSFLFSHGEDLLLGGVIVGGLLLALALLLALSFSLLLLLAVTLDLFFEDEVDGDLVVLLEVAGDWDLNDGGVVLEIEKETIQMDVDGTSTEVVEN